MSSILRPDRPSLPVPNTSASRTTRPHHHHHHHHLSLSHRRAICATAPAFFYFSPLLRSTQAFLSAILRNATTHLRKKPDRMYICITGVRGWPAEAIVGLHQHFPILITRLIGFSFRFISSVSVLSLSLLCPSTHSPSSSFFSYLSSVYSLFSFFARSVCCSSSSSCRDVLYLHIFFVSLFVRPSVLPSVFDRLVFSSSA